MTATQRQLRRGSAAQMATFTGALGEVVVDTTNKRVVVHDGVTPGGFPAYNSAPLVANNIWVDVTNGNDSNPGTSPGVGGAFKSFTPVLPLVAQLRGPMTVNIADGTYDITAAIGIFGEHALNGRHIVEFLGNVGSPGNVIIRANTNNQLIFDIEDFGVAVINGVTLVANTGVTGVIGIYSRQHAIADFENSVMGSMPSGNHFFADELGTINLDTAYTVSGGTFNHIQARDGGQVHLAGASITVTGTPSISFFANIASGGVLSSDGNTVTITGSISGTSFIYDPTAIIKIGSTTLPGSAGTDQRPGAVTGAIKSNGSSVFSQASAADFLNAPFPASGRLTLTSGTPVLTGTVSGAGTIYFTPYRGALVPIYNGSSIVLALFSEISNVLANSSTGNAGPAAAVASSNYDLFVWSNSGVLTLTRGPAWSSSTSRGTGAGTTQLTTVNGILVNAVSITNGPGANLGTYVGTVRTNGSATVDYIFGGQAAGGLAGVVGVWNMYNRVDVRMAVQDSTASWTYSSATVRASDNSTNNRISFVSGLAEDCLEASFWQVIDMPATLGAGLGIGLALDSASAYDARNVFQNNAAQVLVAAASVINNYAPQIGFHFIQALENADGTNTSTFFGASSGARMSLGLNWRA